MENRVYLSIDGKNLLHVFKYDSKTDLLKEDIVINDISKDLNYEIKNDLLIITNPEDIGSTVKISIG